MCSMPKVRVIPTVIFCTPRQQILRKSSDFFKPSICCRMPSEVGHGDKTNARLKDLKKKKKRIFTINEQIQIRQLQKSSKLNQIDKFA